MGEIIEFRQPLRVMPFGLLTEGVPHQDREPRRVRPDLMVPAEGSIQNARVAVQELGAPTVLLAEVEELLKQAQDKVSDWVDQVLRSKA